ncbi:MAG: hypothetical protein K0Q79_2650 [Flavipsychrobacter sp.]|jgi:hypothetical protein|nr:hypothetical protein [Flavipsychrobacter sp.]
MSEQITINFSPETLALLKQATKQRLTDLIKIKEETESAIEKERAILKALNGGKLLPSEIKRVDYNEEWSWTKKAKFILSRKKKLLTLTQILTLAKEKYNDTSISDEGETYTNAKSNLAGLLKQNLDRIFQRDKLDKDIKYYYYGLLEWFDENGDCKSEFLPD